MTSPGTVIVALHDGFYGSGTGAGNSNHAFLRILASLITPTTHLAVLPIQLTPRSSEYDPAWHQETRTILTTTPNHTVIPADNGSGGLTRFGGLNCFRTASASAAASITRILAGTSRALIVAFDVPFFGLAPLLSHPARACLINVARATAALQAPGDIQRFAWERAGLLATAHAGGYIAATSRHIREHLTTTYHISPASITGLANGLTKAEQHPSHTDASSLLPPAAQDGFLLSFGRAEPYKGFDDLLDALHILHASHTRVPHIILAAVTDTPPLTAYQHHLRRRIISEGLNATLHTTFSPIIRALLSHPSLDGVVVPSRAEPFGRIPLEAYAAGASPVIATTAGGLAETVISNHTGYTAIPADPPSLAAAIRQALTASPDDHARMRAAGRYLITARYDYETSVRAFFTAHAPWALASLQST